MPIISTLDNQWEPYEGYVSPFPGESGYESELIEQGVDVNINDSVSGDPTPVGGVIGWDGDYIQASVVGKVPLTFVEITGFLVAGQESLPIPAKRLSTLVICPMFDTSGATATIYPVYEDTNGIRFIGAAINLAATTLTDANDNYYGELTTVDTLGSSVVGALVLSISAGLLALMISCV